jgi:signal transduction histidine kinase
VPAPLDTLERLGETFAEQTGLGVQLEAQLGRERLPREAETALYRIVQEALTNVVKHARAENVSILLTRRGAGVAVVVEDDGRGFDPADVSGGSGLQGMADRLAAVGGSLEIRSTPGRGTTVAGHVPVTE